MIKVWKYENGITSVLIQDVSYSASLQQITRHRSFAFSVKSSRAAELKTNFTPAWQAKGGSKMFDQKDPNRLQKALANAIWSFHRGQAKIAAKLLEWIGMHRQHAQLPLKPFATVDVLMTGNASSWNHFFSLRLDKTTQKDTYLLARRIRDAMDVAEEKPVYYGRIHGPFIDVPIDIAMSINDIGFLNTFNAKLLACEVTKAARVSTGKYVNVDPEYAIKFVRRLIENGHASPFEHFWTPAPNVRSGYLHNAVTLRYLLNL